VPLKIAVDSVLGGHPLPVFLQPFFPESAAQSPTAILLFAIGLLVAVAALGQLQGLASTLLQAYIGERLVLDFRARLVNQVQRLSVSYHDSRRTADSLYRIQHDVPAIQNLVDGVIPSVSAAITLAMMIIVTVLLDWQLALVALAICPPLFFLSGVYRPRMRSQWRHAKKLESSALAAVQETLGALRLVKAFRQEARETDRFLRRSREGMAARLGLALLQGRYGLYVGLTMALGTAAVLLIGVRHVRTGALTLGQLLLVMGYLAQLYQPLKTISRKAASLQSYLASAERAFALLDERPDVPERLHARLPPRRPAGPVRHRPPGARVVFDQYRREHRLRAPGSKRPRHRAGGEGGGRARLHREPAARLCDAGRRARDSAFRRRAPARRAGARIPEGRAAPDPRRADELGRREDRSRDPRSHGSPDAGPHGVPDHASVERARDLRCAAATGA